MFFCFLLQLNICTLQIRRRLTLSEDRWWPTLSILINVAQQSNICCCCFLSLPPSTTIDTLYIEYLKRFIFFLSKKKKGFPLEPRLFYRFQWCLLKSSQRKISKSDKLGKRMRCLTLVQPVVWLAYSIRKVAWLSSVKNNMKICFGGIKNWKSHKHTLWHGVDLGLFFLLSLDILSVCVCVCLYVSRKKGLNGFIILFDRLFLVV